MSTGHSVSQRLQPVHLFLSIVTRSGANLFVTAKNAPSGQRYLHQNRLMSIEVMMKVIKTLTSNGAPNSKLKSARAGQIYRKGG